MSKEKKRLGRPWASDRRKVLPFRLKGSLVEICRARGREWLESLIEKAGKDDS